MTVLGAMVFGGLLALGVLWLLVTAPESDVDRAGWDFHWADQVDAAQAGGVLAGSR